MPESKDKNSIDLTKNATPESTAEDIHKNSKAKLLKTESETMSIMWEKVKINSSKVYTKSELIKTTQFNLD